MLTYIKDYVFSNLKGNYFWRFEQTAGSRLLIFSHTKLETGAVIKSRKYCTVPVEETDVALPAVCACIY